MLYSQGGGGSATFGVGAGSLGMRGTPLPTSVAILAAASANLVITTPVWSVEDVFVVVKRPLTTLSLKLSSRDIRCDRLATYLEEGSGAVGSCTIVASSTYLPIPFFVSARTASAV